MTAIQQPARSPIPAEIKSGRVIAIGRHLDPAILVQIAGGLVAGGVPAFEITLNSRGALEAIAMLSDRFGDGELLIGAGTVLDIESAEAALGAGAQFLVSPHTDVELIAWAAERAVPVFPGAFTATEVLAAWRAGATAVKLFPASVGGPALVREMRGPLGHIPLVPTGGITLESAALFIEAGAVAIGIGSWLTGNGDPDGIGRRGAQLVHAVSTAGR